MGRSQNACVIWSCEGATSERRWSIRLAACVMMTLPNEFGPAGRFRGPNVAICVGAHVGTRIFNRFGVPVYVAK